MVFPQDNPIALWDNVHSNFKAWAFARVSDGSGSPERSEDYSAQRDGDEIFRSTG